MTNKTEGRIVQIMGPVVDVEFSGGHLPEIYDAVEVPRNGDMLVLEAQKHLGDDWVRCLAMGTTDGLQRGLPVEPTGAPIKVPVGQSAELFYALRRLGKTVEWVNYTNGGHCTPHTTEEDFRDYHDQIASWFDQYLMKPASPDGR